MHCVEADLRFAYLKVIDYLLNTVDPTCELLGSRFLIGTLYRAV